MLVNYATILYTPKDVQDYTYFYLHSSNKSSTDWITQYLDSRRYELPVVVSISKSGYPNHQGSYEYYNDPIEIYHRHFSESPLIPLKAILQPANYPEYYI